MVYWPLYKEVVWIKKFIQPLLEHISAWWRFDLTCRKRHKCWYVLCYLTLYIGACRHAKGGTSECWSTRVPYEMHRCTKYVHSQSSVKPHPLIIINQLYFFTYICA